MKALVKTLFGDGATVLCVLGALGFAVLLLHSAARPAAGVALPLLLLGCAGFLARR